MELEVLPSGLKTVLLEGGLEVKIYYLECLAQATYTISHEGVAFIVDPRRDVDVYIKELEENNLKLKGILETHFHADFVSGHCELAKKTGATIYYGPGSATRAQFDIHELKDNEVIEFTSRYGIKTLHTPGHTPESVVYLVVDRANGDKPLQAFTGDTLFIGSCGRPDLVGSIGHTAEDMARMMYHSLWEKIATLPDDVQVFPAHGAGSPCGKNLGSDLYSTIGKERLTNPCFQYKQESDFIQYLTADQPTAPQYFSHAVAKNWLGVEDVEKELSRVVTVPPSEFSALMSSGDYTVIDTRKPSEFSAGHIPGSLSFSLGGAGGAVVGAEDGNFAIWVGTLISSATELLIVTERGKEGETLQRLSRIAYTNVKAVLQGGIESYREAGLPLASFERIDLRTPNTSLDSLLSSGHKLLDVRTETEFKSNSAVSATNTPLASINSHLAQLDKSTDYIAFCVSGYRSAIATSLLRRAGFKVRDVYGGFAAISVYAPSHTTSGSVCPRMQTIIDTMLKT